MRSGYPSAASSLPGTHGQARTGHAFAEAARMKKLLFQLPELLVEQVVGLVDQADEDVRHGFSGARFDIGPIELVGLIIA